MPQREFLQALHRLRASDPKLRAEYDHERHSIISMTGRLTPPGDIEDLRRAPHLAARRFVAGHKDLFGGIEERTALADGRATTDRLELTHVVLQQRHGQAEVLGAGVSVHFKADGSVYHVLSHLAEDIDAPEKARLDGGRASEIAVRHAGREATPIEHVPPRLVVAPAKLLHRDIRGRRFYLCWQVRVAQPSRRETAEWVYFIDAGDGEVLFRYNALIAATATGYHSSGTAFHSSVSGATHVTLDTATTAAWPAAAKPAIRTYDNAGSSSPTVTTYRSDADDIWGDDLLPPREADERAIVDVHRYLGCALNYFYLTHGHNSWDGAGADLIGAAHYGTNTNNAYWSSDYHRILVGDGDGITRDYYSALDVLVHEFTHGVNNGFDVVQIYDGETGALNEAIADVFAAFASLDYPAEDSQPWVNGEKKNLTGRARNLADPSRDDAGVVRYDTASETTKYNSCVAGYCPDHYSIRYLGASDYHGVHCNCTIIGHALYLMVNGGTHRLSGIAVPAIGVAPAEQMLYHVISTPGLLTNTSNFADFRRAMITACQTLFPDNLDYLMAVKAAFKAVGIGPDLYVRDYAADDGEEPGAASCMSPDIINRKQAADAATLAGIADVSNTTLGQNIEFGPGDNYVYFRIFNGGSSPASGSFRLFVAPASSFPTPATWHEVGVYDFPPVPAGGHWTPAAAGQCIVFPSALIHTLGVGHYCFIGIIENEEDPPPDRMQIHSSSEFHDFIRKSNNYAWRNCEIEDTILSAEPVVIFKNFQVNAFGPGKEPVELEIDARYLPSTATLQIFVPREKAHYLKFSEVRRIPARVELTRAPRPAMAIPLAEQTVTRRPMAEFLVKPEKALFTAARREELRPGEAVVLGPAPGTITRMAGILLGPEEAMKIHFAVKFGPETGARDVHLAFRQIVKREHVGQMNFVYRLRKQ